MFFSKSSFWALPFLATRLSLLSASPIQNQPLLEERDIAGFQYDNLRIEGKSGTIYEGPILSNPRNITTASGGTHPCTGQNNNANPNPGATPTTALDEASKLFKFKYDGTYSDSFQDYFITSIGDTTQTSTQFWGLLVNYQFTPTGGCQFETKTNDNILWAFDAFNAQYFLKLTGPSKPVPKGKPYTVTVTDGSTGTPVQGATVNGATTGADGTATITPAKSGLQTYKAEKAGSIRSNRIAVVVL